MGVTRQQMAPLKRAAAAKNSAGFGSVAMVAPVRTRSVRLASASEKEAREAGEMMGMALVVLWLWLLL